MEREREIEREAGRERIIETRDKENALEQTEYREIIGDTF